jgi:hypothetical protein
MGKYITIQEIVFSIFNATLWKAEKIKTIPSNFVGDKTPDEFIRVSIIPSSPGVNRASISGILIIEVFTKAGNGPTAAFTIADKLDSYLGNNVLTPIAGTIIQFSSSVFALSGLDTDNPSLYKSTYTIPFIYTEVL